MKLSRILLPVLLMCCAASVGLTQGRRPLQPADILRVASVSDAQISPNGQWVVYSVATTEDDKTRSTLWLAPASLGALTQFATPGIRTPPYLDWPDLRMMPAPLLNGDWNAGTPRWSPDSSSIAFQSKHDDLEGVWVVRLDKREPKFIAPVQTTNFFITYAGESFAWSPDSRRIAFISAKAEISDSTSAKGDDPKVIDRIQYKSRTALSDNRRTHVFLVDVDRPQPQQLTSGPFYDHALSFSPKGGEIAFISNHEPDPDANNNSDIFAVDFGGQIRQLTQTKGCEYDPVWSPNGKWIAYTTTKRDVTTIDSVAEDTHVWIIEAAGGGGRELAAELDRRARDPRWSPDSRSVYFLAGDHGYSSIFRAGVDTEKATRFTMFAQDGELGGFFDTPENIARLDQTARLPLTQAFQISSFSLANRMLAPQTTNGFPGIAFTLSTPVRPAEIWLAAGNVVPVRRLSAHNDGFIRSARLTVPEEMNFSSFDGTKIQAWVMKPQGCTEDRKCPLILSIHGGPHGMFDWSFNPAFQVYVSKGYGVLFVNPRGSSGYGQRFSDGTLNEWGGGDYKDLMYAVDEALKRNAWVDPNRLGVTGGSYGGFMTNWIITQTPRFRGAVAVASVSNLISFYSTSLYQDLVHAEFGGFPWDNYELLWQWSPIRFVRQVQTPTLFLHGENDNDVHITQAEEMYMALKRRGVDSVFVRYPREGHGLREAKHRVDALERTIAWFDRYVKGSP